MGKIFCVMGKSASGKDTVFNRLFDIENLNVKRIIPYTTRPIREGEVDGKDYIFCNEEKVEKLSQENRIIELRAYDTVYGVWKYFTVDDGQIELENNSYLLIGTLKTYTEIRNYFGSNRVIPIYIEVEDGDRLMRAIQREKTQNTPKYEEMCRRFLADAKDFSEENLKNAGVERRFINENLENTIEEIANYIRKEIDSSQLGRLPLL